MADTTLQALQDAVLNALHERATLRIVGGNSRDFLGRPSEGRTLSTRAHSGIIDYQPTELVVRVRAGTPLRELEEALDEAGQYLPFSPPRCGEHGTVGGMVATGLSGPTRPFSGSVRDALLGIGLINGQGQCLNFGGQVMKNVAGFDLSRLMCGAQGIYGVITEVSLKVLPKPAHIRDLQLPMNAAQARLAFTQWMRHPWPLAGLAHADGRTHIRLAGASDAVAAAARNLGAQEVDDHAFWLALRNLQHPLQQRGTHTWRLSIDPAKAPTELPEEQLIDWGGAVCWLHSQQTAQTLQAIAQRAGGQASGQRTKADVSALAPAAQSQQALLQRIKNAFDPQHIFNPYRLYAEH